METAALLYGAASTTEHRVQVSCSGRRVLAEYDLQLASRWFLMQEKTRRGSSPQFTDFALGRTQNRWKERANDKRPATND